MSTVLSPEAPEQEFEFQTEHFVRSDEESMPDDFSVVTKEVEQSIPFIRGGSLTQGSATDTDNGVQNSVTGTDLVSPIKTEDMSQIGDKIRPPRQRHIGRRFHVVQQWEAVVADMAADSLCAQLFDLNDARNPVEVAEFSLSEFSESDREILAPGSVFYLIIGYERSEGGQIRNVSEMRVRRTPTWSKRMVTRVHSEAQRLLMSFENNDQSATPS